ncbi:MAG: AAC(3) family N-acetyltransferase [Anaerolineae bacterium]|nr:AAC(3) family N-acetyltransferase [Anaerolineae bacterium]
MALTQADLTADLRALGIRPGMLLLVHSSLSSLGHVTGGAETVIAALLEALGPEGTLLAPTLTGTEQDSPANPPAFDPLRSPAWTGIIPETLRQRPDAIRSLHPTHSAAAIGPQARALTGDHLNSLTPCDALSPYGRLTAREEGAILLLGVTHAANTTLHAVEEAAASPYHMQPEPARCTLALPEGTLARHYLLHSWDTPRRFDVIEPLLLERGIQRNGQVGAAVARLVSARSMFALVLQALRASPRLLCQ